jgi:hypothetical protein
MDADSLANSFSDLCLKKLKPSKQREQRLDSLLHSCPVLCTELGLQGLARLATTSSGLRDACDSILRLCPAIWLASALDNHEDTQRWQAAVWVLQAAPAAAVDGAEQLARSPLVPVDVVEEFVSGGTCVTYAQLLAASHDLVAGVEVWVQVQQQLGVQTDIPAVAEAICCSSISSIYVHWVSPVLLRRTCCLRSVHGDLSVAAESHQACATAGGGMVQCTRWMFASGR